MTALDLTPVVDAVTEAVNRRLAEWELAQPRPRMIPLREAADLLGVSDQKLRQLAPRLPLAIDKAGHTHAVSSVHVYRIIEAGGIEACLAVASTPPAQSGDRGGVDGASGPVTEPPAARRSHSSRRSA